MKSFVSNSIIDTHHLAAELLKNLTTNLICLYGDLGTGKTTFVQGLAKALGINHRIVSPTFVIVREYDIAASSQPPAASTRQQETGNWMPDAGNWQQLIHIDCYRLDSAKDTKSFNPEEFWSDPKNLVVIEWAERIRDILPRKRIDIKFKYLSDKKREITLNNLITQ